MYLNDIEHFRNIFTSKIECPDKDVAVKLLIAWYGEIPLAAMFLIMSSHRATYLYGASSSEHRNVMPAYALQWKAMMTAKMCGCSEYDFFGIAPKCDPSHPMYGLYKFKSGFGGDIFHQLGCWDYPVDERSYEYYSACELSSQGYYH